MFTRNRMQIVLTLAVGVTLGYAAASGRFTGTEASTAPSRSADSINASGATAGLPSSACEPTNCESSACCLTTTRQELLLAQARWTATASSFS